MVSNKRKEIIDYFNNKYSKEEAIEKLKQNSRKYAKRQLTWFKRDSRIQWLDLREFNYDFDEITKKIVEEIINAE